MRTELTGEANQEMLETVQKALAVFIGKKVRIVIEEDNGEKRRNKK
jgi:hypothetical protein